MKFKDYYAAMGLTRDATPEDIKRAYRKLARQHHPDISKDPEGSAKFQEVGEAYAILKDPEKRRAYDQLGQQRAGEQFTPAPEWSREFDYDQAAGRSPFDEVDLSDLFAAFGAGRRSGSSSARRRPIRNTGQDYELPVTVTLEQIYAGAEIEVSADIPTTSVDARSASGTKSQQLIRTFRIVIPQTAAEGTRLRLRGKGGQGINGGAAGDLYVVVKLQVHSLYRVVGRDLYLDLPVAPWELVLGASINIPTPGGTVALEVKSGTIGGQHLRLAKRGLKISDGTNAALYVVIKIVLPEIPTPAERKLWSKLATASTFQPRRHFPT